MTALLVRPAAAADLPALTRLAALDSALAPTGDVLLAESCGRLVAALSADTGAVVADPFTPTADIVELLRFAAHPAPRRRRRSPAGLRLARA